MQIMLKAKVIPELCSSVFLSVIWEIFVILLWEKKKGFKWRCIYGVGVKLWNDVYGHKNVQSNIFLRVTCQKIVALLFVKVIFFLLRRYGTLNDKNIGQA